MLSKLMAFFFEYFYYIKIYVSIEDGLPSLIIEVRFPSQSDISLAGKFDRS